MGALFGQHRYPSRACVQAASSVVLASIYPNLFSDTSITLMHRIRSLTLFAVVLASGTSCGESTPREPDLPRQSDRWVTEVPINTDSKVQYIGKTRELIITSVSEVRSVDSVASIRIGQEMEGVLIGAIRCSFNWRNASYGGEQFMWRGQWSCQAGRTREELEQAVADDGSKRFDYISISRVVLDP